jgi:drug/metabolite transporter (DMT)-like permease
VIIGLVSVLYNKAMTLEEASRVVPMFYLNPIFVLPLAYFFLNETLSFQKYAGVFLLVISAALISYKKLKGKFRISPALIYILLFSLVWAGYEVSTKYIFSFIDYFSFLFWTVVGALFGGLILLFIPKIRDDFIVDMRKANKKKVFFWRLITVAVYYTGVVSIYIAISIGLISLVSAIPSLQPLFVLLYTLLLSFFMPKVLSEKVSKLIIFTKILSIILIFVGTLLVVS